MKKIFTILLCSIAFSVTYAQWNPVMLDGKQKRTEVKVKQFYSLDLKMLRSQLKNAPEAGKGVAPVIINIPTLDGKIEKFAVYSAPVVVKSLADRYQLGSYSGVGVDDPTKFVRFSISPYNFQSMLFSNGSYQFIEPQNKENSVYGIFPKTNKTQPFECHSSESFLSKSQMNRLAQSTNFSNDVNNFEISDDKKFRTYRLAISVTGEYTQYFGGTVAGALAGINATMTRVNGVFERDFAIRLLLQDFPELIYTNPNTDPYSDASTGTKGAWNLEVQQTLTSVIGNDAYDIGHLFGGSGGGGNAGDVGNVCRNPINNNDDEAKGSAFTSPPTSSGPEGDNFDIDYVAHEMGHQFGADHTFAYVIQSAPYNSAHMEPGSGSTIMGYAGITNYDVQPHSDAYFHARSIEQVQSYVNGKSCDVNESITNNPPVVATLPDLTIPKGTAFKLTASATDAEGDPLTYTWEEYDRANSAVTKVTGNNTTGPKFRSFTGTSNNFRYFPKLSSVLAGQLISDENWEAVSNVPRTMNFKVTVRDNNTNVKQQQTAIGYQKITVGSEGPFKVISTEIFNNAAAPFNWDVAGTNAPPYNVANVKIDYTTNNGASWTVLKESTPNDGSENLRFTSLTAGDSVIVRVSTINNVFFTVGKAKVLTLQNCTGKEPKNPNVFDIATTSASFTWIPINNATYILRYRMIGAQEWIEVEVPTNKYRANNLKESEEYEYQVAAVCSGTTGNFTEVKSFVTGSLEYCTLASENSTDEYISNVTITPEGGSSTPMTNTSGTSNYTDYSGNTEKVINLSLQSTDNVISVAKAWAGAQYNEAVTVWIDFNRNGTFEPDEIIMQTSANKVNPVTATFAVPADAYNGNKPVRMRVALRYNQAQTDPCGSYTYGEVEDYAINLKEATLGVVDQHATAVLSIYPNPATNVLNITKVSGNANYTIHNIAGQVVAKGKIIDSKVNVSSLVKGVYIISVDDNGTVTKMKFIKN